VIVMAALLNVEIVNDLRTSPRNTTKRNCGSMMNTVAPMTKRTVMRNATARIVTATNLVIQVRQVVLALVHVRHHLLRTVMVTNTDITEDAVIAIVIEAIVMVIMAIMVIADMVVVAEAVIVITAIKVKAM